MRVAPAASMAEASAKVRMPPAAFTPISGPAALRIRRTSSTVAPPAPKPVEVFTKSNPSLRAIPQAATISPRSRSRTRAS